MGLSVDASNSCIPPTCNLIGQAPPLPTTERGIPLSLDGSGGRLNADRPLLVYPSGRLVVIRELSSEGNFGNGNANGNGSNGNDNNDQKIKSFVYRGHSCQVTVAKFSPSGAYVASADIRGKLRVWSYDNEEHLCKLDLSNALAGPIRDLSWDFESKRIVIVGQGSKMDATSVCTKVIQWDSGVKLGDLGQHSRCKASSCAFKPQRPMRIVTSGAEDFKCILNKGPPFAKVPVEGGIPSESCHVRGAIHCVRYNKDGTVLASVGTDKSVVFYDGKTMECLVKMENVHTASIYSCAWNASGDELLTCAADGTAKLISYAGVNSQVTCTWNVSDKIMNNNNDDVNTSSSASASASAKVPMGGMLMGCAFVQGDVPVSVALNGSIAILPREQNVGASSSSSSSSDIRFLTGHQAPISSLAIHHESAIMYTGDSNGVICQWKVDDGSKSRSGSVNVSTLANVQRGNGTEEGMDDSAMNRCHRGAISGLTCDQNGSLWSIGWDDQLRKTNGATMQNRTKLDAQPNAIIRGSELVVIMTVNGMLLVRDNKITSDLITLPYEASSVCVSSDDSTVYIGGKDNDIHVYSVSSDYTDLEEIHKLTGTHLQPVYALALSHDGTKLASADTRDICVWNVEDNYAPLIGRSRWCFHQQKINTLAWSQDDSVLASGGSDDSIYLWSLKKKTTRVHYRFAHRGGISCLEFLKSPGMVLVSVGNDGCVNQWDITDHVMKKFG